MESVFLEEFSPLKLIKISIFPSIFLIFLQLWSLKKKTKLPPGPTKLPLIGNLNQLMTPSPHKKLRYLALKYGPLMYLKLGMVPTIVVSSADAAEKILKTNDLAFAGQPELVAPKILDYNYSDIAFAPYGTYWRQLRKICILELLSSKRVNSFASARREELNLFLQSITSCCGGKPINFAEMLFALNHDITTRITFGCKADDQIRFRAATKEGTVLVSGFQIGDFFPSLSFVALVTGMTSRIQKIFAEMDGIINKIIDEHTERNKRIKPEHEDLLDVLLRIMENEELEVPLTIDNIKSILLVEKLKDLCLKQREEIKSLKNSILFPDVMNSQLQEFLEKQSSELKQAKQLVPSLQRQVTSLTGQLQCLAVDLAEVKADKYSIRGCYDSLGSSPRTPDYNQEEAAYSLEFSSEPTIPGSPDDMLLKDLNPCLTPYSTKTKSKEFEFNSPDNKNLFKSNIQVYHETSYSCNSCTSKVSKSSECCQRSKAAKSSVRAARRSDESKYTYRKQIHNKF